MLAAEVVAQVLAAYTKENLEGNPVATALENLNAIVARLAVGKPEQIDVKALTQSRHCSDLQCLTLEVDFPASLQEFFQTQLVVQELFPASHLLWVFALETEKLSKH